MLMRIAILVAFENFWFQLRFACVNDNCQNYNPDCRLTGIALVCAVMHLWTDLTGFSMYSYLTVVGVHRHFYHQETNE